MSNLYRGKVLLAEDNSVVAIDLVDFLMEAGAEEVYLVASTREALDVLKTQDIRYAVLDLLLTDGKSFPVADELKRRGIPFAFGSGLDEQAAIKERYPAAGYVEKPFTGEILLMALADSLKER